MASSYKDFLEAIAPSWLLNPRGRRWVRALGDGPDSQLTRVKEAVLARMPLLAPEDALAALGNERVIPRGGSETAANYAARIAAAWDTWPWAGTPYGMLRAFWAGGYTNVKLEIAHGKQFSLDANGALVTTALPGGSWEFDPLGTFWSKFLVLFTAPLPAGWSLSAKPIIGSVDPVGNPSNPNPPYVEDTGGLGAGQDAVIRIKCTSGGFAYEEGPPFATFKFSIDDGVSWFDFGFTPLLGPNNLRTDLGVPFAPNVEVNFWDGGAYTAGDEWRCVLAHTSTPTPISNEAQLIRNLINAWKPAYATCDGIILTDAGELWGYPHAGASWGGAGNWGGNAHVVWSP
jgi:hypothetical protein